MKYSTWSVTNWCKNLKYNEIMKKGSENDKVLVKASNTRYKIWTSWRGRQNCQTYRLLCIGGIQGIFNACICIFTSLLIYFYSSNDDNVLRCSVVSYFNWLLYYVPMPLMWNDITWDTKHVLLGVKIERWNKIVSSAVIMHAF